MADHVHDVVNSGSAYIQQMETVDIDEGDILTWSVTSIPADIGMAIDIDGLDVEIFKSINNFLIYFII